MSNFDYTTVDQQIQKLKAQRLSFGNENFARSVLKTFGYYNIINGYRDPYITRDHNGKTYVPGVTFEQIFDLFSLDHSIRNSVLVSMIDMEEHLKAVAANIIAEAFGCDYADYIAPSRYRNRATSDPRFGRDSILNTMEQVARTTHIQPIQYYRENHPVIPPWILFKGLQFGTFVNYLKLFKGPQKTALVQELYSHRLSTVDMDILKDLLSDTLFLLLEYRNLAAHGGRIYNYIPRSTVRYFTVDGREASRGLPLLLSALSLFEYSQPFERLHNSISASLSRYCSLHPNDVSRLEIATGFDIELEDRVWINPRTKKFHLSQYCSGSKNNAEISLKQAKQEGFVPCKRCFK